MVENITITHSLGAYTSLGRLLKAVTPQAGDNL